MIGASQDEPIRRIAGVLHGVIDDLSDDAVAEMEAASQGSIFGSPVIGAVERLMTASQILVQVYRDDIASAGKQAAKPFSEAATVSADDSAQDAARRVLGNPRRYLRTDKAPYLKRNLRLDVQRSTGDSLRARRKGYDGEGFREVPFSSLPEANGGGGLEDDWPDDGGDPYEPAEACGDDGSLGLDEEPWRRSRPVAPEDYAARYDTLPGLSAAESAIVVRCDSLREHRADVAAELGIPLRTLERHLQSARAKLREQGRAALVLHLLLDDGYEPPGRPARKVPDLPWRVADTGDDYGFRPPLPLTTAEYQDRDPRRWRHLLGYALEAT